MIDINVDLLQLFINLLIKKISGSDIKNEKKIKKNSGRIKQTNY